MTDQTREALDSTGFAPRCLSIDLEVGLKDQRIHQFAAVRGDSGESLVFKSGDLLAALARLDDFAQGCSKGDVTVLNLRSATQHLKDTGYSDALPEKLWRLVKKAYFKGR